MNAFKYHKLFVLSAILCAVPVSSIHSETWLEQMWNMAKSYFVQKNSTSEVPMRDSLGKSNTDLTSDPDSGWCSTTNLLAGAAIVAAGCALYRYYFSSKIESLDDSHLSKSKTHRKASEYEKLIQASENFNSNIGKFPTKNNRISKIAGSDPDKQKKIVKQAGNVRPIVDARVMALIDDFLAYKKEYGSNIEKKLYNNMTVDSFVDRLLVKRPLMFMTEQDQYVLHGGKKGVGGFESIGTDAEKDPLILKDYLSYDEMQISALLGVSVPTFFINNGARNNRAQLGGVGSYEEDGIYTGLVGARFEKQGVMEWQHMMVTLQQNKAENGYGPKADTSNPKTQLIKMWEQFYGEKFATFEQATADTSGRYIKLDVGGYLDSVVYKKRLKMVIEPFLVDANDRGKNQDKQVYCHAVGLGLGVWQIDGKQADLMLEVYKEILSHRSLPYIADIDFSWFPSNSKSVWSQFKISNNGHITIHFSKRNPADKLLGNNKGKLLVAMYAWDGNSYPGNEYWDGRLSASGDPAAACCSTIAELQNPLINTNISSKKLFKVD